ncbi:ATP-binding cassette sub-family B member 10, mitochondrial-like [Condylostylus longicornis]|uniref:ATP-binding cassette sub-family B member 10, mitochondrial-like n=1 Tax=Condylostylus longicornis TaxID=2530218 RepID=UPI00244E5A8D|nr:ATP-binding cassette sub-family B member 10, mitochondrial-like [Condylostylus longicornis]
MRRLSLRTGACVLSSLKSPHHRIGVQSIEGRRLSGIRVFTSGAARTDKVPQCSKQQGCNSEIEPSDNLKEEHQKCDQEAKTPRQSDEEQQERKTASQASLATLWSILSPEKTRLKLALGSLIVSSSATLVMPKLFGVLVDAFNTSGLGTTMSPTEIGLHLVGAQSGYLIAAIVIGALASGMRLFLLESSSERIAYRLRVRLFDSLMNKKIEVFDRIRTGELINRLSGDVTVTSRVLLDLSFGIRNILTAIVGTVAIFAIVPAQLVASLVGPVVGIFALGVAYGK